MKAFVLRAPERPWGDYGAVLFDGYLWKESPDALLPLCLERTGPYLPPWTFPFFTGVVVTASTLARLETSGLSGMRPIPVIKRKIVALEWRDWDPEALPRQMPAQSEPENYIDGRKHNSKAAAKMDDAYVLAAVRSPKERMGFDPRSGEPVDFFMNDGKWAEVMVNEKAKAWLEDEFPDEIEFEEVDV